MPVYKCSTFTDVGELEKWINNHALQYAVEHYAISGPAKAGDPMYYSVILRRMDVEK